MNEPILIVDDSAVLRASVRFTLTEAGYQVVEASDGKQGLDRLDEMLAKGTRPAMILTDVNMPGMDGITFIKNVKQTPARFVPILVLTTESQAHMKDQGRAAGASGWLVKPFQPQQLRDVLQRFVRGAR